MLSTKRKALLHLKNAFGWRTKRKIVVFSVDDYGNIRIASKKAWENLRGAGLDVENNRFNRFDSLETREDLTQLFDVLTSVHDMNGRNAVFTAFALPVNPDFQAIKESGYETYTFETLNKTLGRLPGYEGTWELWQEGMEKKILVPQFHGREHLNINFFNKLASVSHKELMACIDNESWAGFRYNPFSNISYDAAFSLDSLEEVSDQNEIITEGLDLFGNVFGTRATHFIPSGNQYHHSLEPALSKGGIKYIDVNTISQEYQGNGSYKIRVKLLGEKNKLNQRYIVRNCVFEPSLNQSADYVDMCLQEIDIAFKLGKPANISTHRINFAGKVEPKVREHGLTELNRLLKAIVTNWPEVEFMSANELGDFISSSTAN